MNTRNKYTVTWLFLFVGFFSLTDLASPSHRLSSDNRGNIRIMFYNVENLFDTKDDSLTNDNEFLPESDKNWNGIRYREKIMHLFKTIAAVGEMFPPEIICFAEIENKIVLFDLIHDTPLEKYRYEIVHYDSPDARGIDVALIFLKDHITRIASQSIPISFPGNPHRRTRDILYFKALTKNSDTLHIFVNHWPSRREGQYATNPFRLHVAQVLKSKSDSILKSNPSANIIITGDFNDEPHDESLITGLNARSKTDSIFTTSLYNLSAVLHESCHCGTYRYRAQWNMFDQFIISGNLLLENRRLNTCADFLHIARFEFLLEEDQKYGGTRPFRTYQGPVYRGGFSDHLPVYLDLYE